MSKDVRRGISLYIDGKEVKGSVKEIKAEMRKLVKEQESMTKGSKEYVEHGKKILMNWDIKRRKHSAIKYII